MSFGTVSSESWRPLADDQLSWFRAEQQIFASPRPLDYSLAIHALVFGLTYALESVEFPLYAVRWRLIHGRVYLAAVPSAMAENDMAQRLANIHDQSLRYTRNANRAWQQQIEPEVERYNRWIEERQDFTGPSAELAEIVRQLRRVRANQWFGAVRGVFVPRLLLQQADDANRGGMIESLAKNTTEAMELVKRRGGALMQSLLLQAGQRLAEANAIAKAEDVFWLEWAELRDLLKSSADRRALITERQATAAQESTLAVPEFVGPPLAANAPRMYLLKEVLQLLDE